MQIKKVLRDTFGDLPRTGLSVLVYNQKWFEIFKQSKGLLVHVFFFRFCSPAAAAAATAVAAAAALPPPLLPIYLKCYRA